MRKYFLALVLILGAASAPGTYATMSDRHYWQEYHKAEKLVADNEEQKALLVLRELDKQKPNYHVSLAAAKASVKLNNPKEALSYYEDTYNLAKQQKNLTIERVALFGMAKMYLWLEDYQSAHGAYQKLLTMKLDKADKSVAAQGLRNSKQKLDVNEFNRQKQRVEASIKNNNAKKAYVLSHEILKQQKNFDTYLYVAQSSAMLNKPNESLDYYQMALSYALNDSQKRVALFGIAKMQLWLGLNSQAVHTYNKILEMQLSHADRKIAYDGIKQAQQPAHQKSKKVRLDQLDQAKVALSKGRTQQAESLLEKYSNKSTFRYLLTMGELYAVGNSPKKALKIYKEANRIAKTPAENRVSLFRIAWMQVWLEHYSEAQVIFKMLLTMPLNKEDHEIALSGLIVCLNNQDYPMTAYGLIPKNFSYTDPLMVVAAAQAASWSAWPYKSKAIFLNNDKVLQQVLARSYLQRVIKEINWDNTIGTAKNAVGAGFYAEGDSDAFYFQRTTLSYMHRFVPRSDTTFAYTLGNYEQKSTRINAHVFRLMQQWYTDHVTLMLQAAATDISGWNPFLWYAGVILHPYDYFWMQIFNMQEYVESMASLANHVTLNTTEADFLVHPHPRFFMGASLFNQQFSDNNVRRGGLVKLIYVISRPIGLFGELRSRYYTNSKPDTPNYFSPATFSESMFILRLRRKLSATWRLYAEGGVGGQVTSSFSGGPLDDVLVSSFELGVQGEVWKNLMLNAFYGYSSTGDNATGFSRNYGGLRLIYFFDGKKHAVVNSHAVRPYNINSMSNIQRFSR